MRGQAMMIETTGGGRSAGLLMLAACVVIMSMFSAQAAGVFRVNAGSAATSPNGLTWATAFPGIQAAIDAAERAGGGEVWVAAGTYTNAGPNAMAVALAAGVEVYGGFDGTETLRGQRDWVANASVLDGQNTYTGVVGDDDSRIDGFTITHCYSSGSGGGMYNAGTTPVVANCVFSNNKAYFSGAGIENNSASPTVINCVFTNNQAVNDRGGAVENYLGSGVYEACVFSGNNAKTSGGAVYNTGGMPAFTNCVFAANTAPQGAAVYNSTSVAVLMNCTVSGNTPGAAGSAVYSSPSSLTLVNCIVWGNAVAQITGDPDVTYSCIQGGHAGTGNISTDPLFVSAPANLALQSGSPCVNTGTALNAPSTDILGLSRPAGAGYDMGAYEYGALPPPNPPVVTGPASPTSDATPTWTWSSGGGGGAGVYRYGYSEGAWIAENVTVLSFTPVAGLSDATHTLYVQERDASNHWSASGFHSVTVNTGAPTVSVPDVVGIDATDAEAMITAAGLTFTLVEQASDTIPAGEVIAQDPAAGTMVAPGSDVTLTVSTGTAQSAGCAGCQTSKSGITADKLKLWFGDSLLSGLALLSLLAARRKPM